jgi:hypothetical protein
VYHTTAFDKWYAQRLDVFSPIIFLKRINSSIYKCIYIICYIFNGLYDIRTYSMRKIPKRLWHRRNLPADDR